jgi:hypothetical protein
MNRFRELVLAAVITSVFAFPVGAADPPVKKSKNDICHPKGGTYYKRTKSYTPYQSMEECIKSGGRKSKK